MVRAGQVRRLMDMVVVDASGDWVGTVSEVYLDEQKGEPVWATVRIGWFGHGSFVPLTGVDITGIRLRAPYDKATIEAAPRHDTCAPLTPAEEDALYAYYGLSAPDTTPASTPDGEYTAGRATRPRLFRYVDTDRQAGFGPLLRGEPRSLREPISGDRDDGDTVVRSID